MDAETAALIAQLTAKLSNSGTPMQAAPVKVVSLRATLDDILDGAELDKTTIDQYERALTVYEEWLTRPALSTDMTAETVNEWLTWLTTRKKLKPVTVRNYRSGLCRIWFYLVGEGVLPIFATRQLKIPKIKPSKVVAWPKANVEALLKAAIEHDGYVLGTTIGKGPFFYAMIRVAYESGLRPVDMRALRWDDIDWETRVVTILQHKTGNPHCFVLSLEAINALHRIEEPKRDIVFAMGPTGVTKNLWKIYRAAEVYGFTRQKGQSLGILRKTHATEIYKQHGLSAAAESLGHVSGSGIAKRHYVDSSACHVGKSPTALE